jgi:hypothetical protein
MYWILLPAGSALEHRPHGPHEIMTSGDERDFLPLWIALLHAIEESADRRRPPACLPSGFSHEPPDHRGAFAGDVTEAISFA